jgi:hypothetical protein
LFSGELFGQGPVLVVALKDGVAVAVEAERHAVGGNQGEQGAEIADGIFAFQLEVSGEDLAGGIRPVAPLEALHLPLAQMQQTGGFAYAQPPACRIFNHLHSLQLFLTHRHHPGRVTESRSSYGVTLSWSIYIAAA